jgi:hypothetical protein
MGKRGKQKKLKSKQVSMKSELSVARPVVDSATDGWNLGSRIMPLYLEQWPVC